MAWHKQHKTQTKDRILTSAAELFTRYGFENVSINQVMTKAQLTRGAFYAHFDSKSDLHAQALVKAAMLAKEQNTSLSPQCLTTVMQNYLSKAHRDQQIQHLCPLAFLAADINQQDPQVKTTYTQIFKGFIDNTNQFTQDEQTALQTSILMIGGLALANALNDTNLSDSVLNACQKAIIKLTEL
ncbi:TetR family transcriptional regulator [Thalassotalea insulae]|uniref:TetR family transcriptional regulator n=1 Tax=Thalassotalea insulae TaxID=2056778 RepID=A0ABQ6GLS0_9GAMM|nr:TetR/AcrR family transcriptional regulator [Thalassotalea insulae]GLX76948.1 TetR family transcriptional regulator [Thalassotalea insulae]